MQSKKIIFTADDLGNSKEINLGILKGAMSGVLSSTCIMPNGKAFEQAVNEILPQIKDLGMGAHLDIIENKSLLHKNSKSLLCDNTGKYNNSYYSLIKKSNDKNFLSEVESEFRSQIEKTLEFTRIDHLNSHVHTHAIPPIFELVCKLAKDYRVDCIRTQYEKNYFVPQKSFNFTYPANLIKVGLLNTFSLVNKVTAKEYGILTNDSFVGVRYTSFMDKRSVLEGLKKTEEGKSVEVLIHPYFYEKPSKNESNRLKECLLAQDTEIKNNIEAMGFEFSKFYDLSEKSCTTC